MQINIRKIISPVFAILFIVILFIGCGETYTPRPMGYLRFKFPKKTYETFTLSPYLNFEKPTYMNISFVESPIREKWFDMHYPEYKTTVHLSYKPIYNNFAELVEDAHRFVYQHTVKATRIDEIPVQYPENKVHGIMYHLHGNVASNIQFILTDSTKHFLRGSMYIMSRPNEDSLAPIIDFARQDIENLMKTLRWDNANTQ